MEKVLITGGAGFIGYHLACNLARRGYLVDIADNFARGVKDSFLQELSNRENVNLLDLDLLEKTSFNDLDTDYSIIFHLAAIIGVQFVLKAPYDVLTKNTELLRNVIEFGRKQRFLDRFVFTSTSEIYAGTLRYFSLPVPTPESTPLTVTDLSENRTSYMLSKIYGEALCLHSGLPVTIIRPHNFYGPRMGLSHVVPELFKKAFFSKEGELTVFSPDHRRTFCYIDDAVEIMRILAEAESSLGQAFNVGNESPEITINSLAEKILKIAESNLVITAGPVTAGSPRRRCPDMTKTSEATGYTSIISLDEGLRRTFIWYKTNVFLNPGLSAI
ncbi:MAG: NAD-dependent epimerase/dehydratase family protein [Candidatus Sabulitectum sp.]|nr:NAD-dependent epimerase/dehydratase family protein [Candidatus Sabulitectum sp.]